MKKRLKFPSLSRRGLPLRSLVNVHEQFRHPRSLPRNVGDGFLYALNPVFHAVRDEALARGFRFRTGDLDGYYSFPLMALDRVQERRIVPFLDNVRWLERLESEAPGMFTLEELRRSELRFNYVFHESAHCVAHDVFFGLRKWPQIPKTRASLRRILCGEAFANTVECVAGVFAEGEIYSYFLDANCFFRANEREARAILRFAKRSGFPAAARAIFAGFLYSNYLFERVDAPELRRIARFAGVKPSPALAAVVRVGLQLHETFRTTTTQLHLASLGFPRDLNPWLKEDPLAAIEKDRTLRDGVSALLAVAGREIRGSWV